MNVILLQILIVQVVANGKVYEAFTNMSCETFYSNMLFNYYTCSFGLKYEKQSCPFF